MKIFIDSAKLDEIDEAFKCGFMDGVTTNPSLMKQAVDKLKEEGQDTNLEGYIKQILETARGTPVSLEVTAIDAKGMIDQGKKIYEMFREYGNVNIKVPVNTLHEGADVGPFEGLQAIKELSAEGIPINCTLIFTPEQALLAAKAGATFVSPFAGRQDDFIRTNAGLDFDKKGYYPMDGQLEGEEVLNDNGIVSGIDLVEQCVDLFRQYGMECQVLAASLRNARQAREAALVGADISTLPLYVIKDLMDHVKTREGMVGFMKDIIPEYEKLTE